MGSQKFFRKSVETAEDNLFKEINLKIQQAFYLVGGLNKSKSKENLADLDAIVDSINSLKTAIRENRKITMVEKQYANAVIFDALNKIDSLKNQSSEETKKIKFDYKSLTIDTRPDKGETYKVRNAYKLRDYSNDSMNFFVKAEPMYGDGRTDIFYRIKEEEYKPRAELLSALRQRLEEQDKANSRCWNPKPKRM